MTVNPEQVPRPDRDIGGSEGLVLYAGQRTLVTRVPHPDGTGSAIRKDTRGAGAAARVQDEIRALRRLAGLAGFPRWIESASGGSHLLLEDGGEMPLAEFAAGHAADSRWLVHFACAMAEILTAMHRAGVVHKDINPNNVLVAPDGTAPVLIDFDIATTFAEEHPDFAPHRELVGTLAYMAPEQTGRTGRAVDHRADLYALGSTLYELATGEPPFGRDMGDPLELVHAHLARVPKPVCSMNPAAPPMLSAIVARLLEKEPDRRYQSAEGLGHDLSRVRDALPGQAEPFTLGERDFPLRLSAPSRLVGREREIERLRQVFRDACDGRGRGLLVRGAPGVGKTVLLDELRPLVNERGGWFVSGKFDQYRQDRVTDAVPQALRALGRLLLAQPQTELVALRSRLLASLGRNAGLIADELPEFAALLGVPGEPPRGDPSELTARARKACVDLVAAVVSPARPMVMVLDDLQWAAPFSIELVDALLTAESLSGLLVVGAYRDAEVDPAHPMTAMLSRWLRVGAVTEPLALVNLPVADVTVFLAAMMRMDAADAAGLADAIGARTDGNPYDTVELVNALRRSGELVLHEGAWRWDAAAIRRFVGAGEVLELITARIDRLPAPARELLEIMACLGGDVALDLLRAAEDAAAAAASGARGELEERLAPALEDGLLVMDNGVVPAIRFRHDRVQQAARTRRPGTERRARHLVLARRLADVTACEIVAAEQYMAAVEDITEVEERRRVARLLHSAAAHAGLLANHADVERYLAAARALLDAAGTPDDALAQLREDLDIAYHAALYGLGRLEEADAVYARITERGGDVLRRAAAGWAQLNSLMNRNRSAEAVVLGRAVLAELGFPAPTGQELGAEIERGLDELEAWARDGNEAADLQRPESRDPHLLVAAQIIDRMVPAAFFCNDSVIAWLAVTARRLWADRGPAPELVGPLAHAAFITIGARQDYRTGYLVVRRILAESEARGYESKSAHAGFLYSLSAAPWFEPLEATVQQAYETRERLVRGGDLWNACGTYYTTVPNLMECAPTLDDALAEIDQGVAFATRLGDDHTAEALRGFGQVAHAMRGDTELPGSWIHPDFDEAAFVEQLGANRTASANFHANRGLIAAIHGDAECVASQAEATLSLLPFVEATQTTARARLLSGIASAWQLQAGPGAGCRAELLARLDASHDWLAARAADAPMNFSHLVRWLDAERAWALGDMLGAARAFEAALRELATRVRPWHRALITERAAMLYLGHGLEQAGRPLLAQARGHYMAWGASDKVRRMERQFPFLLEAESRPSTWTSGTTTTRRTVSAGSIDLIAVLEAAQAISSERHLDQLRSRVVDVLTHMTGATRVQLALWDDGTQSWFLPACDGEPSIGVEEAGERGPLPLSAFRFVERTRDVLRVEDATRDDRFARDPHFAGLSCCSLLVVPVVTRGEPRAMLVLENHLSRGAFPPDRLDSVMLIAGQLAVSMDNALSERFRSLVQRSADLTLVCDRAGSVSYASAASVTLLGIEDNALSGRPVADLVPEEDRGGMLERIRTVIAGQPASFQCRLSRADSAQRWVDVSLIDMTADPAVRGIMLHLRDITERRRLEGELQHAQRMESVGRLSAGLAHEINTPIQYMSDNLAFLEAGFAELADVVRASALAAAPEDASCDEANTAFLLEEIPQALASARDGATRVATIVRAMKAFGGSGDAGGLMDVNDAVNNTLVIADSRIREAADVVTDLGDVPALWCDPGDINQVVLHLVINAAQAMADKLAAGGQRGTLTVRTRCEAEDIVLEVEDTGVGIPAEIADRVFDQFFTTREVDSGSGQGLALVYAIVHDHHGGTVRFDSKPGVGTTFIVRLPARRQAQAA